MSLKRNLLYRVMKITATCSELIGTLYCLRRPCSIAALKRQEPKHFETLRYDVNSSDQIRRRKIGHKKKK